MRILHVTDTYLPTTGGIETMVSHLAAQQRARGDRVRVLTRTEGPALDDVVRDPGRLGALVLWADVVHVHFSVISPLAAHAARVAVRWNRPVVASVHSMWCGGEGLIGLGSRLLGWGELPILWAPVSRVAAQSVRRGLGPRPQIRVLPNAIDLGFWQPATSSAPQDRPVTLVSVGRMAPRKRPLSVVHILHRLRETVPSSVAISATLVGNGPQHDKVCHEVRRLGLSDWVSVPGALPHDVVRELYSRADIAICPSRLESFGLAALEARTSGLAVLARRGTGVEDFLEVPDAGMLLDSDEEMAAAAARLVLDRNLLDGMKQHNRTITPRLGWSEMLDAAQDLYRQAAALQPTRSRHELTGALV